MKIEGISREGREKIKMAKTICLFGVGVLLRQSYSQVLLAIGREPDMICDNLPEKWGQEIFGKKCISPAALRNIGDNVAVIITVKSYGSIYKQLSGMGIKNIFVCCFDRSYYQVRAIKELKEADLVERVDGDLSISVKGKWTLITGAARGVGRQIAIEMAKMGSNVMVQGRCVAHLEEMGDICRRLGVEVVPIGAELSNLAEVEIMLGALINSGRPIDIVFNNAAIPCSGGFWSASTQEYLACYTVNAVTPIRICQRLVPPMMDRGFGRVINITSSVQERPETIPYACSKAALDKFSLDIAPSLRGSGVMIALVDPGWVRTDMTHFEGPNPVESVIPGALIGALYKGDVNGRWFSAQDYAGMSLEAALHKAEFLLL
jgi:3-oxoacyl-[acyl-carrier protein] reductase